MDRSPVFEVTTVNNWDAEELWVTAFDEDGMEAEVTLKGVTPRSFGGRRGLSWLPLTMHERDSVVWIYCDAASDCVWNWRLNGNGNADATHANGTMISNAIEHVLTRHPEVIK
ncbi:hypothetical protein ACFQ1S_00480 [Kibdelosporangium lantanae]|uniref:DUF3024 domain-containing protein n=1 Tax=Kibdelosporangium lantanae TaxID=1497396 RepID=A0ABW3M0F6_9PSEU